MTNAWQWYAVRCCCTPTKVFGFLRLPAGYRQQYFTVREKTKRVSATPWPPTGEACAAPKIHEVRLQSLSSAYTNEIAIYSEDRPLEFWRNIEGFVEVADE